MVLTRFTSAFHCMRPVWLGIRPILAPRGRIVHPVRRIRKNRNCATAAHTKPGSLSMRPTEDAVNLIRENCIGWLTQKRSVETHTVS